MFAASLLKDLRHTNIVTLHDIVHTKDTLTFVFEYVVSIIPLFLDSQVYMHYIMYLQHITLVCRSLVIELSSPNGIQSSSMLNAFTYITLLQYQGVITP